MWLCLVFERVEVDDGCTEHGDVVMLGRLDYRTTQQLLERVVWEERAEQLCIRALVQLETERVVS